MESAQKRKMHVELARLHLQHFLYHNSFAESFTEKKTQTTFPSSYGVLQQPREQEPLVFYSIIDYFGRLYRPPIVECRRPKCLST